MRRALKSTNPLRGRTDPRHGTASGYGYWGCRCNKCRAAATAKAREFRASREITEHNRLGYELGCRCEVCRSAKMSHMSERAAKQREWRKTHSQGKAQRLDYSTLA